MTNKIIILSLGLILMTSGGCATTNKRPTARSTETRRAVCELGPTAGSNVHGTVTFTDVGDHVRVVAHVTGLTPGYHGFHIHEYGDCSGTEAETAGGHYNPYGHPHAGPEASTRHVGDLGNLHADINGRAFLEWDDPHLRLEGPHSIIGRSVIVHAGKDDLVSQPTGGSGARVACGAIGIASPE